MVEKAAVWKPYVFPSPLGVLNSYEKLVNNGTLFAGIGQTLRRIGIGYGISILIGLFLGMLLARFKALSELMKPLVLGIQTLPSICWVPFAILWYGLAESATIFIVVIGSTFSICIAVETGIRSINPLYIRAAKTMGAKGPALYTKVILPASVPSLVGALKQGWSFAWRALMTGEMMMSSKGIGLMLSQAREIGGINEVTAVMLVIVLISIFVDKLIFGFIEKHALKWT
ncbi:MAG TPA: ABC transporter permease [Clostridiales bacterium]|nr:ABC transporter permease [Clostridiales bacterium]